MKWEELKWESVGDRKTWLSEKEECNVKETHENIFFDVGFYGDFLEFSNWDFRAEMIDGLISSKSEKLFKHSVKNRLTNQFDCRK